MDLFTIGLIVLLAVEVGALVYLVSTKDVHNKYVHPDFPHIKYSRVDEEERKATVAKQLDTKDLEKSLDNLEKVAA